MNTFRFAPHRLAILAAFALLALLPGPLASAEMESAISHYLSSTDLRGTQVSICVMDIGQRELLAEIHADREMIPASNMKLVTTAAALHTLGQDFTFSTQLRLLGVREAPAGDGLPALVIVGDGDPALGSPSVLEDADFTVHQMVGWWLDAVEATGMNQFGQIIVDDRIFENGPTQRVHPTWPRNQLHRWYCAQVMGINFYDNCFLVRATPGSRGRAASATVYPYGPFVTTEMRLSNGNTNQWGIYTQPEDNRMSIRGEIRNQQEQQVAMHDPAMVFGQMLQHELSLRGITVGEVVRPESNVRLEEGRVLHQINTTLQAVLNRTNRDSMNLCAEALLKRSGHELTGTPGSFENGAAAVRDYLATHIPNPTLAASIRVADGSGMSRDNRVSARALVEVLRVQAVGDDFRPYLASLARPGEDGSLRNRLEEPQDLTADLYAKTGTLNHVSALSGYLVYPDEGPGNTARVLAFSILVNGHGLGQASEVSAVTIRAMQDELVRVMDREIVGVAAE